MGSILMPGYLRWDGFKYVLDPTVEIVGPAGPPGPSLPGPAGPAGPTGPGGNIKNHGTPLVHNPYETLNFVGNAVVASDAGAVATITINTSTIQQNGASLPLEPNINFINAQVFDDPGNSATKILNTPGIVPVNNSTPGTLTNTLTVAECDTSTGTCSVTFPALDSSIFDGLILSVYDIANNASGNAVTVHPSAGTQIEDPNSPGSFGSGPVSIAVSSFSATWILAFGLGKWKLLTRFPDSLF